MTAKPVALLALLSAAGAAGCGGSDSSKEPAPDPARLDPEQMSTKIDNPYMPMRPGDRWVYRETDTDGTQQRVVVTVTDRTRKVANGVTARVVRDTVSADGQLVEDTLDWYAQHRDGDVWYLGEATKEYENGRVTTTEGSWEAGVDGAKPGIVMQARPKEGMRYQQEYYAGHAEDRGEVLATDEQAEVPFGHFTDVLMTRDTTALEPDVVEHKFYARGIGMVLTLDVSGAGGREELISHRRGTR